MGNPILPQPRKVVSATIIDLPTYRDSRYKARIAKRLQVEHASQQLQSFEEAVALLSLAAELLWDSISQGEPLEAHEAIEQALRQAAPNDEDALLLWAAISATAQVLSTQDSVVLMRGDS